MKINMKSSTLTFARHDQLSTGLVPASHDASSERSCYSLLVGWNAATDDVCALRVARVQLTRSKGFGDSNLDWFFSSLALIWALPSSRPTLSETTGAVALDHSFGQESISLESHHHFFFHRAFSYFPFSSTQSARTLQSVS
jgi:hypothetical protein